LFAWANNSNSGEDGAEAAAVFPVCDGSLPLLQPQTMTYVVQQDGKLLCTANMMPPPPELEEEALRDWVVAKLRMLEDEDVVKKLPRTPSRILVVAGGKVVNFVTK